MTKLGCLSTARASGRDAEIQHPRVFSSIRNTPFLFTLRGEGLEVGLSTLGSIWGSIGAEPFTCESSDWQDEHGAG